MRFRQAGIILVTCDYAACVAFYGNTLKLPLMFQLDRPDSTLSCFDLGGVYLMVEPGRGEKPGQSPVKLRFNVEDVAATADSLRRAGVEITVNQYGWGTTAEFSDPDGNCCTLRSVGGFGG